MSSKTIKIVTVLVSLLALTFPASAKSAGKIQDSGPYVSTEVNPSNLHMGETAVVTVKLNNVPVEGYKSAEFMCTYNAGLVEKSNIAVTDLFGAEPVTAFHDHQSDMFIVAIAGANSNRAVTSGPAFTFSAKALQVGQSQIVCTARVSAGDNLAIDIPSTGSDLTILDVSASPTVFVPATPDAPTALPEGSVRGQILASKPVTVRLLDANEAEITSVVANTDGMFLMTPPPGEYTVVAKASGFLSYKGSVTLAAGDQMEFPSWSLIPGDVDGNDVIDQFDALTIGMSYSDSTPDAADLNSDAIINFLDLELLAENYRQTGPTTGSPSPLAFLQRAKPTAGSSPTLRPNKTQIAATVTSSPLPGPNNTVSAPTVTGSPAPIVTQTMIAPTATQSTGTTGPGAPRADAPLCPTHDPMKWHGLWDPERGCHYDHEHGTNPFTAEVAAAFPGFDLFALLGNVSVGHTNLSSAMENTHKHGGFKWNVQLHNPEPCVGFESATTGVDGSVIEYHGFGDYAIEAETRIHSTVALIRQCQTGNPTDYGYIFVNQLQDYGQRITPYQGTVLPYPNQPVPGYPSPGGPYLTFNCVDMLEPFDGHCRPGFRAAQTFDADTNWSSKPTQAGHSDSSPIFKLFWRARDTYKEIRIDNFPNVTYPFQFLWLCSSDNGATYNPVRCRYNNTTTQVHEIAGVIPAEWDNLAGWDTNPAAGRVTAQGFVNQSGAINSSCAGPSTDLGCFPIRLVNAFTGSYGSVLVFTDGKGTNIVPIEPERDIYFCNGAPCTETSPGAVPSGWVGPEN